MDSLYFACMIVGIGWLAVWTALPDGLPFASPFDALKLGGAKPKEEAPPAKRQAASRKVDAAAPAPASARTNAASSWRERTQPRRVDVAGAEASAGPPDRRPVASWRTRRDPSPGARRRR